MILRLLRFNNDSWKSLLLAAAMLFVLFVIEAKSNRLLNMVLYFSVWAFWMPSGRINRTKCTLFQAVLPIPARDIFLSHMLPPIALYWLNLLLVLAAAAVINFHDLGLTFARVLGLGSVTTLGLIAMSCVGAREFAIPQIWKWVFSIGTVAAMFPVSQAVHNYGLPAGSLALVTFGCAGGVLLWSTLRKFPATMGIAPDGPERWNSEKMTVARLIPLPASGWTLMLRAVWQTGFFFWLLCLGLFGLFGLDHIGAQILAVLMAPLEIWTTLARVKDNYAWLFLLPFRWETVFLPVAIAPLLALGIGTALSFSSSANSTRSSLIGLLIISIGSLVLPGILIGVPSFAQGRREVWFKIRAYTLSAICLWIVLAAIGGGRIPFETWLNQNLPTNPALFGLTILTMMATALWIAYKGFCRAEVRLGGEDALVSAIRCTIPERRT
jgi:hypothetical protein